MGECGEDGHLATSMHDVERTTTIMFSPSIPLCLRGIFDPSLLHPQISYNCTTAARSISNIGSRLHTIAMGHLTAP